MLILLQMRLFAGELRKRLAQLRPMSCHWALVAMPSPVVRSGFYEAGGAVTDLDGLN
jgi:hypothetical protein